MRQTIFDHLAAETPELLGGEVELDESYFGGHRKGTLVPIIKRRTKPDSVVYTDSFAADRVLDAEGFRHLRINHRDRFVAHRNHINGIETFWSEAKRHLRRCNGVPKAHFHLYLTFTL